MKKRIYIKENSWLARFAAKRLGYSYVAMVFGTTIHLWNTTTEEFFKRPTWVRHELKHVEQYQRMGTIGFLWNYLIDYARVGYYQNYLEIEARAAENDNTLLEKYEVPNFHLVYPEALTA